MTVRTVEQYELDLVAQIEALAISSPAKFYPAGGPTAMQQHEMDRGRRLAALLADRIRAGGAPEHLLTAALAACCGQGQASVGLLAEVVAQLERKDCTHV